MYKKIINGAIAIVFASIVFSGCAATTKYATYVTPEPRDKTIVFINVDQDATSLGGIMSGSVVRTNYMYSFATAAQATKDAGYTYFSVIAPDALVKQLRDRKVQTVQDAYDACSSGSSSFAMGWSFRKFMEEQNNCDSIVRVFTRNTLLGGTVVHKPVSYTIKMHNDIKANSNFTFKAQDVLNSDLISSLDSEYFVKNKH